MTFQLYNQWFQFYQFLRQTILHIYISLTTSPYYLSWLASVFISSRLPIHRQNKSRLSILFQTYFLNHHSHHCKSLQFSVLRIIFFQKFQQFRFHRFLSLFRMPNAEVSRGFPAHRHHRLLGIFQFLSDLSNKTSRSLAQRMNCFQTKHRYKLKVVKMLCSYEYRMYPNDSQKELLAKHFGHCRWFYNYALNKRIETYKAIALNNYNYKNTGSIRNTQKSKPVKYGTSLEASTGRMSVMAFEAPELKTQGQFTFGDKEDK